MLKYKSMEGYSGTPLARKLGIKNEFKILLVEQPEYYKTLFTDFPETVYEEHDPSNQSLDFIHIFSVTLNSLKVQLPKLKPLLKKNGILWISWPKGTSKITTDLNRDIIRSYMLTEIKLVDVKVAAIDADWSGLKFMYRKEDRK